MADAAVSRPASDSAAGASAGSTAWALPRDNTPATHYRSPVPVSRSIALGVDLFSVRTPTLPPATHTNCYALGTGEVLVVEPAPSDPSEQRVFVRWVRGLASQGMRPIAIVCTHHHGDHVGGATPIATELGLPLWAHEATAARMQGVTISRHLRDGERLELDGPTRQTWTVLHTPGHAPGHVCLHEARAEVLVLGDMIATQGTILIAPSDGDMAVYLSQLRRLEALHARLGLPAHGEPIPNPSTVLRKTHDHRLMREDKVMAAIGTGGSELEQLLERAYDDTPVMLWPLARLSLQSHLDKLVHEQRVYAEGDRWYAIVEG